VSGLPGQQAVLRIWDDDACARVHEASLRLLAGTGVEMKHERARALCAAAGAAVDGTRVRLPQHLVDDALAAAPRSWKLRPRGGQTQPLELTDGPSYFGTGPDCLYVTDHATGERRRARLDDVRRGAAVAEVLPNIDFVMSMGLPEDVPAELVDVAQFAAMLKGTRKPIVVSSPFDGESLCTMTEMAAVCGEAGSFACLAMSSPPLMLDRVCCDKTLVCAELQIPLVLAASVSAGAQGPASLAACVAVANAEVLAALVLHQLARPGAPFVFGAGTGVLNMRTLVDPYGSPGVFAANQAHVDLIKTYGLPSWSYAGHSDSKLPDEQWALELGVATILGALSRATLLHDVGYLETGLQGALEGIVLGDEAAGYARALAAPLPVDDDALALAEVETAGPGGSHLGRKMTRARHRDFWQPGLIDHHSHEQWLSRGEGTLLERTRRRLQDILAAAPAFELDPAAASAIDDLARRPRKEHA
jgi:trimethylamine---corrinoid protein Co-methyltransferase